MLASTFRALVLAGIGFAAVAGPVDRAAAAEGAGQCRSTPGTAQRICRLPLDKSFVIDLPRDASDILVSNPEIADAVVRTARRIYVTGIAIGQTNIFVFDSAGGTILSLELVVERDIGGLHDTLARLLPGSNIQVDLVNNNVVLSGAVRNAADARRAMDIAQMFAGPRPASGTQQSTSQTPTNGNATTTGASMAGPASGLGVVNLLNIEGEDQVHVKVTVAEIDRTTIKQLGVDWNLENFDLGGIVFASANPGAAAAGLSANAIGANLIENIIVPAYGEEGGKTLNARRSIGATVDAMESAGLLRTLAEPTLTAISGESASFLAGGEFPFVTGVDPDTGTRTIEYKPFGVSLSFTPVVLSEGRISLHLRTEVSEVSPEGAGPGLPPLFDVRRAETTMELPSGGALVMGGLIRDTTRQSVDGLPGLKRLPVLGALFGSRSFQRRETELVIIVTPYLVQPVAPTALARPDDGFAPPSDAAGTFLNRLNRMYGVQGQPAPAAPYHGRYGFIIE